MTWLPQSQDLRIPANLTFPSIWSPLSSSKLVNNLCISLVEVNQASIVFENDLAARVSGYQAPAKVNPDWGFPHIFLFNFLEIFFDRHLDIWREQPCGQTRGRSKSCASCGAIPKSVSKKRVFYRLGKQTDWGPHSNGKFENSFDRLGFWWNLAQGFIGDARLWIYHPKTIYLKTLASRSFSNFFLDLVWSWDPGLSEWPRLHTVSQWVSAKLDLDVKAIWVHATKKIWHGIYSYWSPGHFGIFHEKIGQVFKKSRTNGYFMASITKFKILWYSKRL